MKRRFDKVTAVLPAYNAAKTLKTFLSNFPFELFDEVILVDDFSTDDTFRLAKRFRMLKVFRNPRNLGYGGNLKKCLGLVLEGGADVVLEIHPDGEYGFDGIEPAIEQIRKGAGLVLGNRFANGLPKGMYLWKVPFIKFFSWIGNLVLGTSIPDLHQGFRVYTKNLLEKIPYERASSNYIFSFQIIALAVLKKIKIQSMPVSAYYQGRKRGASLKSSINYSLGVLKVLGLFLLVKSGLKSKLV